MDLWARSVSSAGLIWLPLALAPARVRGPAHGPRRHVSMSTLAEIHAAIAARVTTLTAEAASSAQRNAQRGASNPEASNRPAGVLASGPMHCPGAGRR